VDKTKFLDLGRQPIANGFLTEDQFENEFFYDLSVGFDRETALVTHMEYVKPSLMFNDEYSYRGSMSNTMKLHFATFSKYVKQFLPKKHKVLEIGSNDGVFLVNWNSDRCFAVEPCGNFAKETNQLGYKTYCGFWGGDLSQQILSDVGTMDLVFAANCMCHIPDLDGTFKAIENILADDGVFIFEDPSLERMVTLNSYDQIYDEHPHVFSVVSLQHILNRNNLSIVKVEKLKVHGGSNRIYVKKTNRANEDTSVQDHLTRERNMGLDKLSVLDHFAEKVQTSKNDLLNILTRLKNENKKVISYGATSKSTTVFNYCQIGTDLIEYITDTTPEKQGKYSPGMHIPIITPEEGFNNSVDCAFLGAWNFADEIRNKEKNFKGNFITHVPMARVL
jgi:methylation protein EvaC